MQNISVNSSRRVPKSNNIRAGSLISWLIRWGILLLFAIFFGVPLLWLLLAITKTDNQLLEWHPMAFGSLEHIGVAWNNLMNFNQGQVVRWAFNSVYYSVSAVLLSMVITLPTGYALGVMQFGGRRILLWLTLILMILPGSAMVLPLFLEMSLVRLVNTPYAVILPVAFYPFGVYLTFIFFKTSMPADLLDAGDWAVGLFELLKPVE
jgi:multiple sugar transport system permease protein